MRPAAPDAPAEGRTTLRRGRATVRAVLVPAVLVAVLLGVVVLGRVVVGVLVPRPDVPLADGPVLVLGGDPARLVHARTLPGVEDATRDLVLSSSAAELHLLAGGSCDAPRVRCVDPVPPNTYGEALVAARLARELDWSALTVVTSPYHVARVRWQFAACAPDLAVAVVAARWDPGREVRVASVVREVLATVQARVRYTCGSAREDRTGTP